MLGLLSKLLRPAFRAKPPADLVWITADLAQSAAFETREAPALARLAIGAVLDLRPQERHELSAVGKAGLHYLHLAVTQDSKPTREELSRAADWVRQEQGDDRKVLVHCHPDGGGLAVMAALLLRAGYPLPDALTLARHGRTAPLSDAQMSALRSYAEALGR